ncbi:MAG: hypothetical protein ACI4EE_03800 [Lachnospiraceae bacterium]
MCNRIQILEVKRHSNHAGSKAPDDVAFIAKEEGFKIINIINRTDSKTIANKIKRQIGFLFDWVKCCTKICKQSLILIQFPFVVRQLAGVWILQLIKAHKKAKIMILVHDVNELRLNDSKDAKYWKKRLDRMISLADIMIVHNTAMVEWFVDRGVPKEKLVNLQIFDYLCNEKMNYPKFNKSITIAGNLDVRKCNYISQLGKLKSVIVNLYGPNFDLDLLQDKNIHYYGSLLPEEIPDKLTEGFGLVWDGNTIDGCQGPYGQYLKYNNPHKLSLFLAAGLPVVIWKEAAEADFVQKNGLGICVDRLSELTEIFERLGEEQYDAMAKNVRKIGQQLRSGTYTRNALKMACEKLEY